MLLDSLKDFEWYNEPKDVRFNETGMSVVCQEKTDFWQSAAHHFSKDDGHFFFSESKGDFCLIVKWVLDKPAESFSQCGIMLRADSQNWFKFGTMAENEDSPKLGSSLTKLGSSDWAVVNLSKPIKEMWYKLVRNQDDYIAYYSEDGIIYKQNRLFFLPAEMGKIKVGVYAASPQQKEFIANLEILNLVA